MAITYGGSKSGSHWCWLTVKPTTVAAPDTSAGVHDRLRHTGQIGTGGWTSAWQSSQPWMRRRPSAPDVQNHSLAGVSWGSGRTGTPGSEGEVGRDGGPSLAEAGHPVATGATAGLRCVVRVRW